MNRQMRLMFFMFIISIHITSSQEWIWQSIKTGNYLPGYKTITIKSFQRPYTLNPLSPRIVPLHIWYPSQSGSKSGMKFIDYVKSDKNITWAGEDPFKMIYNWTAQYIDTSKVYESARRLTLIRTDAILNAKMGPGKFPVILMGNGLTSPGFIYSLMAEYFASHGYIVVAYPSLPENSISGFGFNQRGILNQISDIELVYNEIAKWSFCDKENMALIAWSIGGASQIMYQMKHKIAKAVVSLDAASQYAYGKDLIVNSVYYDSTAFSTPFLNLSAAGHAGYVVPRNDFFFDSLAIHKKQIICSALSHSHFVAFNQYLMLLNQTDIKLKASYEKICETIRLFLDFTLLGNRDSRNRISTLPSLID